MISVENLVFDYPGKRALDNISFHIPKGGITALVGPNGAGKTTLLRCMAALDRPIQGQIRLDDVDVLEHPRVCHRRVGYLSDFFGLYDQLTVRQCLSYVAGANDLPSAQIGAAVDQTASRLGLEERLDIPAGQLSRGQRQRVAIGQAIIHSPDCVILDEPASGLDPEARHSLAQLFTHLRNDGMTLIVSSHILAELEDYSTDMLILRDGRIVDHSRLGEQDTANVRIKLTLVNPWPDLHRQLVEIDGIDQLNCDDHMASFLFSSDGQAQHGLLKSLLEHDLPIRSFGPERQNLQDTYLATVNAASSEAKS